MRGPVALLSPAAVIPKRVHARTRCSPSPPLPRERGRSAKTEKTGKETCRQAVCGPSAFCSGALLGLGTRAGHHCPHVAGTCLAWRWVWWGGGVVGVGDPVFSPGLLPKGLLCTSSCFLLFFRVFCCVFNSFLGLQGTSFLLLGFMHLSSIFNLLKP